MTEVTLKAYEDQIDQMIEEARYLEALAHLRHILKRHPRCLDAYYLLGKMFLDAELPELAVDMFQRVLTADPENLLARIGLGLAHDKLKHLQAAVWNLERAYEIDPGNEDLAGEIASLRAQQSGVVSDHVPLTRAGLAHLYLRGGLYSRAVEELRALLNEDPNRLDLQVALAEAYWRDDQIVQASNLCQQTLDRAPYCLKPNLLLGTLWLNSGQEEGKRYLNRAQEVDPENHLSANLFGTDSLLSEQEIALERLMYEPDASAVDKESAWFKHLESSSVSVGISEAAPEMSDSEMRLVDITASLESQIKIPDWLSDLGITETGVGEIPGEGEEEIAAKELSAWLDATEETEVAQVAAGIESTEETPDWLQELGKEETTEETLEEIPGWLQELGSETAPAAGTGEEVPSWLQELEPSGAEETLPEAEAAEEVPDWLREMKPAKEEMKEEISELAATEEVPEWLREIEPTQAEELAAEGEVEEAEGVPDWLQELGAAGVAAAAPGIAATEEVPEWLQEIEPAEAEGPAPEGEVEEAEGVPDWLQELSAAGKVAPELAAAEEAPEWLHEIEPTEAEGLAPEGEVEEAEEVPDWLQELGAAGIAEATPELATAEEIPDWLQKAEPTEAEGLAPEGEVEEAEEVPDWLQELGTAGIPETEPEIVTAEEVPEWLQEVETPKATGEETAVFGWTSFPAAEAEETAPGWLQELPGEAPAVEEETMFGWTSFPGAEAEAPQVAGVTEEEVPDWLRELQLPEETPAGEPIMEAAAAQPPTEEGGLLSGDDALSWLESLAAGKEDELRAQAEAEAQVRVAEIMGRKPEGPAAGVVSEIAAVEETARPEPEAAPVEEQVTIEAPTPEEVPPVEGPKAPAAEGEVLSGDDALVWLQSLMAGKEDELRAQAEAEAQVRIAEIMGRKPEEKPAVEAPVVEEVAPPEVPEAVAEEEVVPEEAAPLPAVEGELLSGDDALSWLQSLTVGKEDELRAQAEAEAQVRVAEIMGRKPEEKPVVEAPVEEAVPPEVPEAVAEEKVITEEAAPSSTAKGELLSGDDALSWLQSLTAGKEEELRAQAEAEAQVRVAEILGRRAETKPLSEKPPVEEIPLVPPELPAGEAPLPEEVIAAEELVEEEEIIVEEIQPAAEELVEEEEIIVEEKQIPSAEKAAEVTPEVSFEAPIQEPAAPIIEKVVPAAPPIKVTRPAVEATPPPTMSTTELEKGRAYIKKHRSDHASRLALARVLWDAGLVEESLDHYSHLIRSNQFMDEVIVDLKRYSEEKPHSPDVLRTLGDSYMKQGLLDKAMEIYRQAMDML